MKELTLARVDLGAGWIDLGYGEPLIIREILRKHLPIKCLPNKSDLFDAPYLPPKGHKDLVALLEAKYGAKVVVTSGAKQGIAAVMYALKNKGHKACVIPSPYWTSTPGLIKTQGLNVEILNKDEVTANAIMITSPNNPDGKELMGNELLSLAADAKAQGVTFIHDAAYYSPIYKSDPTELLSVGDVQIYSFAKQYGLAGIRVGYVVLHDETLVADVAEFVEKSCSGVSGASQLIALAVETHFRDDPASLDAFHNECRNAIKESRRALEGVRPDVMQVETCTSNSMFAWGKAGPALDYKAAKVNVIHGDSFGKPGYIRLNLSVNSDLILEAIERLNKHAKTESAKADS